MRKRARLLRYTALIGYYGFAWFLPGAPVPGYQVGQAIRRFLAALFLEECGSGVEIKAKVYFGKGIGISLRDRSIVGKNSILNPNVSIGPDTLIGPDVMIWTMNHRFENRDVPIRRQGHDPSEPVSIGRDVWIASRVIILPGVCVGDGAVVGAGSVVSRDVPAWAVVAGNPARIISWRGENQKIPEQHDVARPDAEDSEDRAVS